MKNRSNFGVRPLNPSFDACYTSFRHLKRCCAVSVAKVKCEPAAVRKQRVVDTMAGSGELAKHGFTPH